LHFVVSTAAPLRQGKIFKGSGSRKWKDDAINLEELQVVGPPNCRERRKTEKGPDQGTKKDKEKKAKDNDRNWSPSASDTEPLTAFVQHQRTVSKHLSTTGGPVLAE